MFTAKSKAEGISTISNAFLIVLKLVAGFITGSISLIAEAIHSVTDLAASLFAFFSVNVSDKPPDSGHPFGHGKWENISGLIEGVLIFVAAVTIIYESIHRFITRAKLEMLEVGIAIMAVSIILNVVLSRYQLRVAKNTDSVAVEADARMRVADIIVATGVLIGLILVRVTGIAIFDPIAAVLVALSITKTGYDVSKKSFGGLIDTSLPQKEQDELIAYIKEHSGRLVNFHDVRTRKSGSWRFIELHLVMPKDASVEEAHQMCDHLEQGIKSMLPNADVTIHVEPCKVECGQCLVVSCNMRVSTAKG